MAKAVPPVGGKLPNILEFDQFYRREGNVYCFRPDCKGCVHEPTCQWDEIIIKIGPGVNIRQAFRAQEGWLLASIDYKQIEIRVAAQLSKEPVWIKIFDEDGDLHSDMARIASKLPKDATPTKAQRDAAKACNFGCLFLGSPYTLQNQSNLSQLEAVAAHKLWWATLPTYKGWTDNQLIVGRRDKAIFTYFRRKRHLDGLIATAIQKEAENTKEGKKFWEFIHRTCVNSPIQGTAADLMKLGMVKVQNWIEKEGLQDYIKILLTVHDELVFAAKECKEMPGILREAAAIMTFTPQGTRFPTLPNWRIPLGSDIEVGPTWANQKSLEDYEVSKGLREKPKKDSVSGNIANDFGAGTDAVPKTDALLLTITVPLTDKLTNIIGAALFKASSSDGAPKVPLKIKAGDQMYRSGTMTKVDEGVLRQALKEVIGVELKNI